MMKSLTRKLSKIPPSFGVLIVALCGLALFVAAHLMSVEQVSADVDLSDSYAANHVPRPTRDDSKFVTADFESPVARMAGRMREASGLALVCGLARVNEYVSKRPAPANVDALVDLVATQSLLPPGVSIPDPLNRKSGVLVGSHATLYVRYRVDPFGVEVVSIPNTSNDGASILIRLPNDEDASKQQTPAASKGENPGVSLYISDSRDAVTIPSPFASPATMLTAGWQPDKFRSLDLPQDRINELNEWLHATGQR